MGTELNDVAQAQLIAHINAKLAMIGCPTVAIHGDGEFTELIRTMAAHAREKDRLLGDYLCPADLRIQSFLGDYLKEESVPRLPTRTFVLDRPGLARLLSLPLDRDDYHSDIISSYRVKQGVLHNPRSDRRTTQGIFHVTEGGLPIPDDKLGVPPATFARMLALALDPPRDLMHLPFTATQPRAADCFVSLLLRPLVCPEVPGFTAEKSMEIRFFVPGSLVSNLDFVESIFGNGGDPLLPENDAALDVEHWTGHTGCVVLAPHLVHATKKAVGLPHWDVATERQRRDGMCWKSEDERYNNGTAFKLTCRDESGVIVTLIADNYFGYCKKEVKTQISYAANLFGQCEQEHAGGALLFPSYDLGEEFSGDVHVKQLGHTFAEVAERYAEMMDVRPEGYGVDRAFPSIVYIPHDAHFDLHTQLVSWTKDGTAQAIRLRPDQTYVRPSGYKVRMEKPGENRFWRLVGTVAEGLLCHKPCTVSGGGKSEISKPITDAVLTGPVFVADLNKDFDLVEELVHRDYSGRFRDAAKRDGRAILAVERSLGSVIKLLAPDPRLFTPAYNAWVETIPQYIKELVFVVKRYYKPAWGDDWRRHFSVDIINGIPGNELKCDNRTLVTTRLRVGFDSSGLWRTFGLRKDFCPAAKIQMEDDITVSVLVPATRVADLGDKGQASTLKFVKNCEQRLFQRPDDAIHRGYDQQTEADFTRDDNFFSNYEPLPARVAAEFVEHAIEFHQFTKPMQGVIRGIASTGRPDYFVSSANPRLVDGKPSKNPRYLQKRPDLVRPMESYLAHVGALLRRRIPYGHPVPTPVDAVLAGRRNNPPEHGIRALACYNPVHYFELPELFMEFICSMTGKSPSTTGAGSEGALTKGPFNALPPIIDLNNALVSWVLTGHAGFVTSAGCIGPKARMDHDISLIIPEVFCRMLPEERDPRFLIDTHCLDRLQDFEHKGRTVLASRLGYRINERFLSVFVGRVFNHPKAVFTSEMLRPELQDMDVFADSVDNIVATQKRVAQMYFNDGSIAQACPPLNALLHIMVGGGGHLDDPELRRMFTRDYLLASDWYAARLVAKQSIDCRLWSRHVAYLENFLRRPGHDDVILQLDIAQRLAAARKSLAFVASPDFAAQLVGTLGAEPIERYGRTS